MAEGGRPGGGTSAPPNPRVSPRGCDLPVPFEHLPAPWAGCVVRTHGQTTPEGTSQPCPVRRRCAPHHQVLDPFCRKEGFGRHDPWANGLPGGESQRGL